MNDLLHERSECPFDISGHSLRIYSLGLSFIYLILSGVVRNGDKEGQARRQKSQLQRDSIPSPTVEEELIFNSFIRPGGRLNFSMESHYYHQLYLVLN